MATDGPLFVAGPDRSGTTLMLALLASHPDLSMVRRTNMWRYFHGRYGDLAVPANFERCLADMLAYRRMRHLAPDAGRIRRDFLAGPPTYGRLFALFHAHHAERAGKRRWGDKSLHTEHHAARVFAEFPDATVVHMVRDPRDRYASVRRRDGGDARRVGAATARWLASARAARRNAQRWPERYLVVRYEDLARDPRTVLARVCAAAGLAWSEEMLTLAGLPQLARDGGNSSFGDVAPGAVSMRAIGRFRSVLSPGEVAFVQLVAGRTMRAFGYEAVPPGWGGRAAARFAARDLPMQLARTLGWLALTTLRRRLGEPLPPPQPAPNL